MALYKGMILCLFTKEENGIIAGMVGGAWITNTFNTNYNTNNNTNNNTIVITGESGGQEIITADDYEQIKKDNEELVEDNEKLQASLESNQQRSIKMETTKKDFFEAIYDGDGYEKYNSSNNTGELKIGGKGYTDAIQLWGWTPFILLNLDGEYQSVKFDAGRIDESSIIDGMLRVYLNDNESGEFTIDAETPLTPIEIQVAGATTMKIELVGDGYKKYGLVNFEVQ
ncbi:hypothetical protein [Lachnoclostridium sp. An76]|uniref:hypothetical protein n=1 Tax=Lachnoclostridium sp. An76 TaxID=1965654 RepID=UPI000B3ABC66|nr:hypothetical protein [Lachnoclostridium sp. An76]OUN35676.1 hypothetical protein B5G27_00510 [Lachnoclostridium sp. An76]